VPTGRKQRVIPGYAVSRRNIDIKTTSELTGNTAADKKLTTNKPNKDAPSRLGLH